MSEVSRSSVNSDAGFPGDFSGEATPVPIPNTAVKLSSADDTDHGKVGHRRVLFTALSTFWLAGFLFFACGFI